jgi:integrase
LSNAKLHLLTALQVTRFKSEDKDYLINDGGGLYLRIRKHGSKEWVFRYTSPLTTTRRKQTLGSLPDTSLSEARRLAGIKREILDKNIDPILQTEQDLQAERQSYKDKQGKKQKTVEAVFEIYKREELQNRKDKGASVECVFKKDVFPVMGQMPIHEVTRDIIRAVLERPLKRKSKRMANATLSDLKQFFRYADDEELIDRDPTRNFVKPRVGGREQKRKRVLSKAELKSLKKQLPLSGIKQHYQHAILLYLATACRRTELAQINLSAIDLKSRNLYIAPDRSKNTDEHNIYLSDFAIKQIKAICKLTQSKYWLLPNPDTDTPIGKSVLTKQITDRQPRPRGMKKLKGRANNDLLALPGGHWILHDLRRTAATEMQKLGIMPHIIKKCLNQRTDDPIMETYQRAELAAEQRKAFKKLGTYLSKIFD